MQVRVLDVNVCHFCSLSGSPTALEIQQFEALRPVPDLLDLLRNRLAGFPAKDFQKDVFPHAPPAASALLREMLRFNAAPPHVPSAAQPPPLPLPAGWQELSDPASGRKCDILNFNHHTN